MTSSTLDGKCKELQVEDADEDQSRKLSACAAWIQDQEEDADDLENFVMEQVSKTHKHTKENYEKTKQNKTKEKRRKTEKETRDKASELFIICSVS